MSKGITIIGWGTEWPSTLPADIENELHSAQTVYVKSLTPVSIPNVSELKYVTPQIDAENGVSDGYHTLAQNLVEAGSAVYLVPGDPLIDEGATPLIKTLARQANIPLKLIKAQNLLTPTLYTLQLSAGGGLQILDATLLCSYYAPPLEPHRPALISGLYHPGLVKLSKRKLQQVYGQQAEASIIASDQAKEINLAELDSNYTGSLYLSASNNFAGLSAFQNTIAHLRAPNGCPWDRRQTHQSLRPYLLEETYEVLTALDDNDIEELSYELGDILLQIALHAQIGAEAKTFGIYDVVQHVNKKMIRRHPHVFNNVKVNGSAEVIVNWATIKAQERAEKGEDTQAVSILDGILPTLPALAQALHISQRAVRAGFEWDSVDGVLEKLVEEAHEIVSATTPAEVESEMGDLLFVAVNVARKLNVDPETALRGSNARFTRRFQLMEELARQQNLSLSELDIESWQAFWQQAKKETKAL